MFEIKTIIRTPEGKEGKWTEIGRCDETRCLTKKGKRGFLCENCYVTLIERKHKQELKNARERIQNVIHVQNNMHGGCLLDVADTKPLQDAIDNIFEEEPIEGLI